MYYLLFVGKLLVIYISILQASLIRDPDRDRYRFWMEVGKYMDHFSQMVYVPSCHRWSGYSPPPTINW